MANLSRFQIITLSTLAVLACFALGAGGGVAAWYIFRAPSQAAPVQSPQQPPEQTSPPTDTPQPTDTPIPTEPPVTPTPRVFEFEGSGSEVWTISTNGGVAVISSGHRGDGNFSAWLYEKDSGDLVDVVANCIDDCEDQTVSRVPPGEYLLEIRARGNYIVVMEFE